MKYIFLRFITGGGEVGAPLRRLAGGRGIIAQRFTALRTRVDRRTPSGAGSMASTSFLAFLAFLAAGFLAAFFAAGFFAAGFLPRAARLGGGASSISSSAGSSSSGGGTSGVGSGSGVAGRLAFGVALFVFLGFGFSSAISSSRGAGVGRSLACAWKASTASCVKDDGKGTEGGS